MHRATRALYRSSTLCAAARKATVARPHALRSLSSYDNPPHQHLDDDVHALLKKQLAQQATDDAEAHEMDELLRSTIEKVKKENPQIDEEEAATTDGDALHVLFPRKGHFQASMEIKKRILYSTPHMKGERLKLLARRHSRHGTVNSFIADLEGRLDRFIYRLNLVPSIFAARHEISIKHILVNGRPTNRPAYRLKPMDVVEVKPGLERHFLKHIRRRLQNNTFNLVLADAAPEKDDAEGERESAAKREGQAARSKAAAESQLISDIAEGTEPLRLRRLPPPKAEVFGASTAELDQSSRLGFDDFGGVLLAMLPALATGRASSEIKRQQRALSVSVPPQKEPDAPAGVGGSSSIDDEDDRAPLRVLWRDSVSEETVPVLTLDRARVRRLMLALLALKSP